MGNFRSDRGNRSGGDRTRSSYGGRSSGGFSGRSSGGFGRDRDRGFGSERRPREMHDVTCDKCGKQCQVPFRPSGDKPVLCSDCFKNSGSNNNFSPRNQDKSSQSGISSEQLNQINSKLDKILLVLQDLELDVGDEEAAGEEDLDDEDDEDDEDDKEEEEKSN